MTGAARTWSALFAALKPLCARDWRRWDEVRASLQVDACYWYSASALDLTPAVVAGRRTPPFDSPRPLVVMNDYAHEVIRNLKTYYGHPAAALKAGGWGRFHGKLWDLDLPSIGGASAETLLPLRFWDDTASVSDDYASRYVSSGGGRPGWFSPIVDDAWHAVYFEVQIEGDARVPVLFWGAESHLVFREVFARFGLPIDVFISNLDQGGKSGTNGAQLANIHPRSESELGRAFLEAEPWVRPRIWNACGSMFRGEEIDTPQWRWNYSKRTRFHRVHWPNVSPTGDALARACYADDLEAVRALLDKNPELDLNTLVQAQTPDGRIHIGAPLVLTGRAEIARLLVARGADPARTWRGSLKVTALSSAQLDLRRARRRCSSSDATEADRVAERHLAELVEYLEALAAATAGAQAPDERPRSPRPSPAWARRVCSVPRG